MRSLGVHTDLERLQKRWVLGALAIAFVLHIGLAGALGWYKIPGMEVPFNHTQPTGPFTIKRIEVNPDALKSGEQDPIGKLPAAEPPKNPAQFNLDTNLVQKALATPQPALTMPSVPESGKVIAAADLGQGLPLAESDSAKITAEISKAGPVDNTGPLTSAKMAEDLISASTGPVQSGAASGSMASGMGTGGKLPGFSDLAPTFKPTETVSNLPDPVLLRLPSDVLFDFDSASLKPDADALLSQAVGLVTKFPEADVHVDGYSDSFGKPEYNSDLSQKRAEAVQAWLRTHVVQTPDNYKFHSVGHGSANYIVSPQGTIDQQQPNRRVEILIQATKP